MVKLTTQNEQIKEQLKRNHSKFVLKNTKDFDKDIVNLIAQMVVEGIQMSQGTKDNED